MFGDAYAVASHHDPEIDGQYGFWLRRGDLTFDADLAPKWSARFRLEVNSPGDFESSAKMTPFVKDAWVAWKDGAHDLVFGISPSPTFERTENFWGYRAVEKTPRDLYRLGSSRDFGVAWKGRAAEGPDRTVSVASVFGAWDLGEKLSLLARVDRSFDGIPDAGDIPYLGLAEDTELDLLLVGLDYRIHEMVSVIPNVEAVADRKTGGIPAPDDDLIARLTLFVRF